MLPVHPCTSRSTVAFWCLGDLAAGAACGDKDNGSKGNVTLVGCGGESGYRAAWGRLLALVVLHGYTDMKIVTRTCDPLWVMLFLVSSSHSKDAARS